MGREKKQEYALLTAWGASLSLHWEVFIFPKS